MGVSFFFLTQIWHLTKKHKKKAKRREKIRNKWTRPSKQKKLCWRNKSRKKRTELFASFPSCFFFFLVTNDNKWPMTTSVSFWDKLDLLARMIVLKKKETIHWPNASEVVGEFNQKKTTLLPQLKKKKHLIISFLRQGRFFAQLIGCNKKTVDSVNAKKKMQQVRVKKLFHYLLPLSVCHVSKGPMPGKTCRTANDYCVLLTLCFVG